MIQAVHAEFTRSSLPNAVAIDAREPGVFKAGSLPDAHNIPRSLVLDRKDTGEIRQAEDDGRLPREYHDTRIIVVGADAVTARYVADAVAREAFQNVTYFAGSVEELPAALER